MAVIHFNWVTFFSRRLGAGCLRPEWLPELFNGLGAPVFAYYPPGYFYAAGLASLCLADVWLGMRWVEFGTVITMGLLATHYMTRVQHTSRLIPVVLVAAAIGCAPAWLAQLSFGGGIPTFFASLPMLYALLRCEKIVRERMGGFDWRLSVVAGVLPWVHNLALRMTLVVIMGALVVSARAHQGGALKSIILSLGVGAGLGSLRSLAALMDSDAINVANLLAHDDLDWRAYFILPLGLRSSWFLFQWVLGGLLMLGMASLWLAYLGKPAHARSPALAYWSGAALASLLFASALSWPCWALCKPLQFFQAPIRFVQPATIAMALGLGCVISDNYASRCGRMARGLGFLALLASFLLGLLLAGKTYWAGEPMPPRLPSFALRTCEQWEYLPAGQPLAWQAIGLIRPGQLMQLDHAAIQLLEPMPCGGLRALVQRDRPGMQRLPIFSHPRWQLRVNGQEHSWTCDANSGLIQTGLNMGESRVELVWQTGAAGWMALAGLFTLVVVVPAVGMGLARNKQQHDSGKGLL